MSGTLNSPEELKYLTINVIKATKLELSLAEVQLLPEACYVPTHVLRHVLQVDAVTRPAIKSIEAGEAYTLDQFMRWFHDEVKITHEY